MAMQAATAAVITGSAHCGGKCDGCAKISPMKVAMALIVAWRPTLSVVRSICNRRATVTAAPTTPQNRRETRVLEAERGQNVATGHHEKTGEPGARELLGGRARKAALAQIIECLERTRPETH
jgi:hypothetical protein